MSFIIAPADLANQEDDINPHPPPQAAISDLINSFSKLMKDSNSIQTNLEKNRGLTATAFSSLMVNFANYVQVLKDSEKQEKLELKQDPTRVDAKRDELKSILPSLRHRVTSLSLLLDPSDIKKDPAGKLEMVIKLLLELEQTLERIRTLFYSEPRDLGPAITLSPLAELIEFKSRTLTWMMTDIFKAIHRLLYASRRMISCLDFSNNTTIQEHSPQKANPSSNYLAEMRRKVLQQTSFSWKSIDKLIEWLSQSDCSLVQTQLQGQVDLIEDALSEVLNLLSLAEPDPEEESGPSADPDDETDSMDLDFGFNDERLPNAQIRDMAEASVPIIKLTRLFLNKLSKNKEPVTILSKMNSGKLSALLRLLGSPSGSIDGMIGSWDRYYNDEVEEGRQRERIDDAICATYAIDGLRENLEWTMDSVLFPYLESLPSGQFDDKIDPKTWFETWRHQFLSAVEAYKSALYPRS